MIIGRTNIGKVLTAVPHTQYGFSKCQLFIKFNIMTAIAKDILAQFVGKEGWGTDGSRWAIATKSNVILYYRSPQRQHLGAVFSHTQDEENASDHLQELVLKCSNL